MYQVGMPDRNAFALSMAWAKGGKGVEYGVQ